MIKLDVTDKLAKLSLSPGDVDAATLSVDYLVNYLSNSGVCCGILNDAIADVVQQVRELQVAVEGVVIAEQIEPRDEKPAPIIQCLGDGQIAAVGDTIAELGAAVAAVDGKTVRGVVIKASSAPETVLPTGTNTEVVDGTKLGATAYGAVKISDQEISVTSLVMVDDDGMTAAIDIHPESSAGSLITLAMVRESLILAGVLHGVNDKKTEAAIQQAAETVELPVHAVVAEGTAAIKGTDAHVEHFVETDQEVGEQREDGSINFHERSTIRNVKSGVRICRRIPPVPGQPRIDLYGQSDSAEAVQDIIYEAGENVELRENEFWSMIDGAVMIKDHKVTVSDIYVHADDIDLQSGNLQQEKGAVHIRGTIRSGFEVSAGSHIIVDKTVEDATLESGGDVEIMGGVIQAENGSIHASGNVMAKFAQNAEISAGGDIVINGAAMNCDLYAASRIIVAGSKARLVGGVTHASDGIQVRQLGAETAVQTRVEIDLDRKAIESLKLEIEQRQEAIAAGEATEAELEKLLKRMHALTDKNDESATINVEGTVYPGVTVTIYGVHYRFSNETQNCQISLNNERKIKVRPLS